MDVSLRDSALHYPLCPASPSEPLGISPKGAILTTFTTFRLLSRCPLGGPVQSTEGVVQSTAAAGGTSPRHLVPRPIKQSSQLRYALLRGRFELFKSVIPAQAHMLARAQVVVGQQIDAPHRGQVS